MSQKTPSELAREALKLLTSRKLPPTPANYQACYFEIAGHPNLAGFPEPNLRKIALALPARSESQQEQLEHLDAAITRHSWQGIEDALSAFVRLVALGEAGTAAVQTRAAPTNAAEFLAKIANLIVNMQPALGNEDEFFAQKATNLLRVLRNPGADLASVQIELSEFTLGLARVAEEQAEIKIALLNLLHLIIENISALCLDDSWLKGQVDALLVAVEPPLNLRRLDDVNHRVREVMAKQSAVKVRSIEAQAEMRQMLSTFIEGLSRMSESSSSFQNKIEESAEKIEKTKKLEDLAPLLKEVIQATRAMADEAAQERDQLKTLQTKAQATEAEIAKLQQALRSASESARHDPLTDALNRKGLDEALLHEIANMRRTETSLSVALLDIDNFKKINDRLGHEAGDAALIHLVNVVRQHLRPRDSLARYGGEEFVILMPDTALDDAIEVMKRFQRELTKNFFLADNEKVLITFSAGVAQFAAEESGADAIKRADQAMYLAKRAGKNRVVSN
jgi:diguanylate cyclase